MTDEEIVTELQRKLAPTIRWYRRILETGSPDGGSESARDYLYDETWRYFNDLQSCADFQDLIEALL